MTGSTNGEKWVLLLDKDEMYNLHELLQRCKTSDISLRPEESVLIERESSIYFSTSSTTDASKGEA